MAESVPNNLCIMPFISLGTKPDGVARVCCMAPMLDAQDENGLVKWPNTNLEKTWNGNTFRDVRLRMLQGEKLVECSSCWKEESFGKKSKRLKENSKFHHQMHRINKCDANGRLDNLPVHLDLRLGNTCNLKCRSCNPLFSSMIAAELRHHPEWQEHPTLIIHKSGLERSVSANAWTSDPHFWNTMDELAVTAEEIYISGGEPTLVPELIDFLERCVGRSTTSAHIRLNSNMTRVPERLINALSKFKMVSWGASIDAVGLRNDWLRSPSCFGDIEENMKKLISLGKPFFPEVNCTVSMFNVLVIDELHQWCHDIGVELIVDVLHNPSFMRLENLPHEIKQEAKQRLTDAMISGKVTKNEIHGFRYVLETLSHPGNTDEWLAAIEHAKILDRWRSEDIKIACPELAGFIS